MTHPGSLPSQTDSSADAGRVGFSSRRFALTFVGLFIVWLLLTQSLDIAELIAGLLVSALAAALAVERLAVLDAIKLTPMLPLHLVRYFAYFFWALLTANLDVARRVLSPGLAIRPDLVEVHTEIQSDLGKLWLANSITLTPGTLTVDVIGQNLRVHWIAVPAGTDTESATRAVVSGFERVLREIVQ